MSAPWSTLPAGTRVCLYGAGAAGAFVRGRLARRRPDIRVCFFVDSRCAGEKDGLEIVRLQDLPTRRAEFDLILVASAAWREIEAALQDKGWRDYMVLPPESCSPLAPRLKAALARWPGRLRHAAWLVPVFLLAWQRPGWVIAPWAAAVPVFLLTFLWRIGDLIGRPHSGCDAYYFLLCREVFRRDKRIPIVLPPLYTLEYAEQWYPPGFAVFLALFSERFLNERHWLISPLLDALIAAALYLFTLGCGIAPAAALAAVTLYIFSPAAAAETRTLTSRQLGAGLLHVVVFCFSLFLLRPAPWLGGLCAVAGVSLLLSHKFSTQALFIGALVMPLWTSRPEFAALPLALVALTLLLSGGFYGKILYSHWDYIRFWTRHWRGLGGHQVVDSPVYRRFRDDRYVVYKRGRRFLRPLVEYGRENLCLVVPAALLLAPAPADAPWATLVRWLAAWSLTVFSIGLASYLLPGLRGIGYMPQYGKLALGPAVVCCAAAWSHPGLRWLSAAVVLCCLADGCRHLARIVRRPTQGALYGWEAAELHPLQDFLRSLDDPLLLALPTHYCDLLAYTCRIRVLWGGHGSPVERITELIPVLTAPLPEICRRRGVTHILIDRRYVDPAELRLPYRVVWQEGPRLVYAVGSEVQAP